MRISDWSSDVCSSDLPALVERGWALAKALFAQPEEVKRAYHVPGGGGQRGYTPLGTEIARDATENDLKEFWHIGRDLPPGHPFTAAMRSEEHTSELQSLMRISYAVFCLKKTKPQ